jgi:hypothetical protein
MPRRRGPAELTPDTTPADPVPWGHPAPPTLDRDADAGPLMAILRLAGAVSGLRVALESASLRGLTVDQIGRVCSHMRAIRHDLLRLADPLMPGGPPQGHPGCTPSAGPLTELLHLDGVVSWLRVAVELAPVRAQTVAQFSRLPSRIREIRHDLEHVADTLMPGGPPRGPQGPADAARTTTPGMQPEDPPAPD